MIVAADSTPLIHLSTVSDLGLLQKLFGKILIPEAVRGEIVAGGPRLPGAAEVSEAVGKWIEVVATTDSERVASLILAAEFGSRRSGGHCPRTNAPSALSPYGRAKGCDTCAVFGH